MYNKNNKKVEVENRAWAATIRKFGPEQWKLDAMSDEDEIKFKNYFEDMRKYYEEIL